MPKDKKKRNDTTSDSDSGPDDKTPAPAKKSKESPPPAKKSKESNDDGPKKSKSYQEPTKQWTLEKYRQVRINEFRGRLSVDIREFYEKDGDLLPGKKGISLSPIQWRKLLEIADEVNKALQES